MVSDSQKAVDCGLLLLGTGPCLVLDYIVPPCLLQTPTSSSTDNDEAILVAPASALMTTKLSKTGPTSTPEIAREKRLLDGLDAGEHESFSGIPFQKSSIPFQKRSIPFRRRRLKERLLICISSSSRRECVLSRFLLCRYWDQRTQLSENKYSAPHRVIHVKPL
jgi:hypothetical protein